MRRATVLLIVGLLLTACSSGPSAPSPSVGALSGVVWAHTSQSDHRTPLADAQVAVYRRAVSSGGPVLQNPPKPVATTTTGSDGAFSVRGLPAGRWFVIAIGRAGQGAWVRFDPATGATVTLVVCSDCPIPL